MSSFTSKNKQKRIIPAVISSIFTFLHLNGSFCPNSSHAAFMTFDLLFIGHSVYAVLFHWYVLMVVQKPHPALEACVQLLVHS